MADEQINTELPPPPQPPAGQDPELVRMQQQLSRIGETQAQMMRQMQAPRPAQQPNSVEDINKEFFRNPAQSVVSAADAVVQQRMREMQSGQYDTLRDMARRGAREGHEELFDQYADEIELAVNEVAPFYHTNINTWKMARDKTFGVHITEIRAKAAEAKQVNAPNVRISAGNGPAAPSPRATPTDESEHFSKEPVMTELGPVYEKDVASKLGLTEAQYVAGKKHIREQSVRGPSSWDPYITFDSVQRRRERRKAANANNK